jgi:hypothetical protein
MREEVSVTSKYGGKENCIHALRKPQGKRLLRRPRQA